MTDSDLGDPPVADHVLDQAATRLMQAQRDRVPCAPVRDLIGTTNLRAAYAVQNRIVAARIADGGQVVGRKIGLTTPAVQEQLGVDRPDFGVLFADSEVPSGGTAPTDQLLQPKIEAEVAFILGADLVDGPLDTAQVRGSVASVVGALEIVDSRVAGWDISFGDTVADNASGAMFVLGTVRQTLDEVEPKDVAMSMTMDGAVVSTGSGAACLGDPLEALRWLAATARDLGEPLRAGQLVLAGALGPMVPVDAGVSVTATLSGLGSVDVTFAYPNLDRRAAGNVE